MRHDVYPHKGLCGIVTDLDEQGVERHLNGIILKYRLKIEEGKRFTTSDIARDLEADGFHRGMMGDEVEKLANEVSEAAVVRTVRAEFLKKQDAVLDVRSKKSKELFELAIRTYQNQAVVTRTLEKLIKQQFSTPIPLALLVSLYVRPHSYCGYGSDPLSFFEPSCGNGALAVASPLAGGGPLLNDIDEDRRVLASLALAAPDVLDRDATLPFREYIRKFRAVATNPPFSKKVGKEGSEKYFFDRDGLPCKKKDWQYRTSNLGYAMALNALSCMHPQGRAAVIVGDTGAFCERAFGQDKTNKYGFLSTISNSRFFAYMMKRYNVVDIISIGGRIYAKNGTTFPIWLILIDGMKDEYEDTMKMPDFRDSKYQPLTTWEQIYDRMERHLINNDCNDALRFIRGEASRLYS